MNNAPKPGPIRFHPLTWALWIGLYGKAPTVSYVEVG
jgi:hypothetical protein